jgi:tetraacyldisaccharide 4'-kinase
MYKNVKFFKFEEEKIFFKLKRNYLSLIEKEEKNIFEFLIYILLCLLSLLYHLIIFLRNLLYDKKILPIYFSSKKIISIGSLSWAGSGKTTLSLWLYKKLSKEFKVAILRRGYGEDENELFKEEKVNIFWHPNRVDLVKKLEKKFDIFILDDGFQYRKLKKDLEILIMGPQDFKNLKRLIPASFLRESFFSLKRADFLVLNYKDKINYPNKFLYFFPYLKIYFASYKFNKIVKLNGEEVKEDYFQDKKVAALTAIGYPEGFFEMVEKVVPLELKIKLPDHYCLSEKEFIFLKKYLYQHKIKNLIITHKDKFHLPPSSFESDLNIFIMKIEMEIEKEEFLLKDIKEELCIR